jgi:hypothetical protein
MQLTVECWIVCVSVHLIGNGKDGFSWLWYAYVLVARASPALNSVLLC